MDVDSLTPGVDFVNSLEESVAACDVLVAVIGQRWLVASDEHGNRRLNRADDFVRIEIATALRRDVRVIPVLVEGALMPQPGDLPEDLKALVRRNALEVSHTRFSVDSERLVTAIERILELVREEAQRKQEEQERVDAVRREAAMSLKDRLKARKERERSKTDPRPTDYKIYGNNPLHNEGRPSQIPLAARLKRIGWPFAVGIALGCLGFLVAIVRSETRLEWGSEIIAYIFVPVVGAWVGSLLAWIRFSKIGIYIVLPIIGGIIYQLVFWALFKVGARIFIWPIPYIVAIFILGGVPYLLAYKLRKHIDDGLVTWQR